MRPTAIAFLITAIPLASCAVGPNFVRPDPPKITQYTNGSEPTETIAADGKSQRFNTGTQIPEKWWTLFNSPKLDPIVTEAMNSNQTVQAALATLRQTQENLSAGEGVFFPQIDASLGAKRQRATPSSFGVQARPSIFNLFTASSTVSYGLDLFGGDRRALEGLKAQVESSQYAALGAYLALTGNIVNTIIARAAYDTEVQATRELIQAQKEEVSLSEASAKSGTLPYANVLALQAQAATTEATLPPLLQKLSQADHLLAVLSGKMPAEWKPTPIALDDLTLPLDLPKSLPSELVRHRPDILQSEALLHIASAEVGVATAALFPKLTISGALGWNSTSSSGLLKSNNSFWSFGADLLAPLFHGGTLRAQRRAALEAFQAALANYRQNVLGGIQQVADALRALEHDAELVQAQSAALHAADESLKIIRANFRAGTTGYLQLLTAQAQYAQAKIGYLQGQAQRYQDTVALFVALGGGWRNAEVGAPRS